MKKYTFLVYHKEYRNFLEKLQELGVLHIIEKEGGELEDESLREKYQLIYRFSTIIKFLEKRKTDKVKDIKLENGIKILEEIEEVRYDSELYTQQLASLEKELKTVEPWGDFDVANFEKLESEGFSLRFFFVNSKKFEESWETDFNAFKINEISGQTYFVTLNKKGVEVDVDAEELKKPEKSCSKLKEEIKKINNILAKSEEIFDVFAGKYIDSLKAHRDKLEASFEFERVALNTATEAENKLMILEGWAPTETEAELNEFLENEGVYYEAEKPVEEDSVPIKLKNSKFSKLFEPIGELYTFPDYKELDLTPFFAPFYMLFFGFCLGDAGYGLLITLGTIYGLFKVKPSVKPLLKLGMYLGIATTIMGVIGGTFFGINLIDTGYTLTLDSFEVLKTIIPQDVHSSLLAIQDVHFEKKTEFITGISKILGEGGTKEYTSVLLKHSISDYPILNSFRHLLWDSNKLMAAALALGYIQVIFGMFINAANKAKIYGFNHAISQLGWIIIIMFTIPFFLLGNQGIISKDIANKVALVSAIVGGIPALFYNSPGKNPLLNFGTGLWDTYGMASGLLGDVLSYIRLFALGISSAILGNVFNTLAMDLSPDTIILRQIVMILILAFGHSLNFFMAALGSFVHPLRLTFVEFYKNAGFMGGGKKYEPFKKN